MSDLNRACPDGEPCKTCPTCGETKPLSEYHKRKKNGSPVAYCKPCAKERHRRFIAQNPDYHREYYRRKPKDPARKRAYELKTRYGLTPEDYEAMLARQGGRCAICHRENTGRPLVVDHCHSTGAVRGLLCDPCNKALGGFRDDTSRLASAILYLENARCAS